MTERSEAHIVWIWRGFLALLCAGVVAGAVFLVGSSVWTVEQGQRGVVVTFGRVSNEVGPGFHLTLPWPFATMATVDTSVVRVMPVGYRIHERNQGIPPTPEEVEWLTGDTNIVELEANVLWTIRDPVTYLFGMSNRPDTGDVRKLDGNFAIRKATEAVLARLISRMPVDDVLSSGKAALQLEAKREVQEQLDALQTGVQVTAINVSRTSAPFDVVTAFNDVASARADRERKVSEANGYAMKVKPGAVAAASRVLLEAEVYRTNRLNEAKGRATAFEKLAAEVKKSPRLVKERLWLDAVEQILAKGKKFMVQPAEDGRRVRFYIETQ